MKRIGLIVALCLSVPAIAGGIYIAKRPAPVLGDSVDWASFVDAFPTTSRTAWNPLLIDNRIYTTESLIRGEKRDELLAAYCDTLRILEARRDSLATLSVPLPDRLRCRMFVIGSHLPNYRLSLLKSKCPVVLELIAVCPHLYDDEILAKRLREYAAEVGESPFRHEAPVLARWLEHYGGIPGKPTSGVTLSN